MARTPDSPEVKAAKALSTKVVARLVKDGLLDADASKDAKASVTAVLAKATAAVSA
jgi:hypothetical protein